MGTFLIALCAFILAYREYNLHKIQQKIDVLSKLNEQYSTDENIQDVIKWMLSVARPANVEPYKPEPTIR